MSISSVAATALARPPEPIVSPEVSGARPLVKSSDDIARERQPPPPAALPPGQGTRVNQIA